MAQFEKHFVQDLTQDIKIRQCGTIVFNGDNLSNVITVDLYNGTEPYSGGGTVAGAVICPDGATVALDNGTLTGNVASVTLKADCFAIPGQIGVGVQVISGNIRTTVLKAIYNVELLSTDNIVDPDSRITASVTQLVADIEAATAEIPASDMAALMAGIAPTFSTSTAYPAGAYVYYNGTLYRFTSAHAAGSWTGTDATAVALGNDVADLKSAFVNGTVDSRECVGNFANGYMVSNAGTGNVIDTTRTYSDQWKCGIIRVFKGDWFAITGQGGNNSRLWVLADTTMHQLSASEAAQTVSNKRVNVDADGYALFNLAVSSNPSVIYYNGHIRDAFNDSQAPIKETLDITGKMERNTTRVTNVAYGAVIDPAASTTNGWVSIVYPVHAGDAITLTGTGSGQSRLWALTDIDYKLVEKSFDGMTQTITLNVYEDGYLICNMAEVNAHKIEYTSAINTILNKKDKLTVIDNWIYGYIRCPGVIGSRLDTQYNYSASYRTQTMRVHAGEIYRITGGSFGSARGFCLLNDNYIVQRVAAENAVLDNYILPITSDGILFVNAAPEAGIYKLEKYTNDDTDKWAFHAPHIPKTHTVIDSVLYDSTSPIPYTDIIAGYEALRTAYSGNIARTDLGVDSSGDYHVYKYVFTPTIPTQDGYQTNAGATFTANDYPVVYMDAGIHGSEVPCVWALLNFMSAVYSDTDDELLSWLRNNVQFVIVPCVCPYGYMNDSYANANDVNLNRNFNMFFGSSGETGGTEPLNQVESQYINNILKSLIGRKAIYYNWHTHGVFSSYAMMSNYCYPITGNTYKFIEIGNEIIRSITDSGHKNHELPANSGLIGVVQLLGTVATAPYQAIEYGIPAACPELMYRYYDGQTGPDYSEKIKCMNVEYIASAVALGYRYFIEGN